MGIIPEVFDVYNYKITSPTAGVALPVGAFVQRYFHANEFEYFLQDTWHVRRNVTRTLGLRYTILQTPYEIHGQQVSPTIDKHLPPDAVRPAGRLLRVSTKPDQS